MGQSDLTRIFTSSVSMLLGMRSAAAIAARRRAALDNNQASESTAQRAGEKAEKLTTKISSPSFSYPKFNFVSRRIFAQIHHQTLLGMIFIKFFINYRT